jgi:hypothetical protein
VTLNWEDNKINKNITILNLRIIELNKTETYFTVLARSLAGIVLYCEQSHVIALIHSAGFLFLKPSQIF